MPRNLTLKKIYAIMDLGTKGENVNMNILSLDLSTKSSGWSVFFDTELKDYGCIASASTDLIKRIYIMRDGIRDILNKYTIDKIVVEEVRPETTGGNLNTHRALMYLQAAFEFLIHDEFKKITVEYVYPSSWRAVCGIKNGRGIKRTSLKEKDIEFVNETYHIETKNDDIADAICIGHAAIHPSKSTVAFGSEPPTK